MASYGTKLSFSFGGPPQAGGGGAPKSNMEMLLAKAKGAKGPSKPLMFGDDDDEDDDPAPTASSSKGSGSGPSKPKMKPVPSRPILEDDGDGAGPSSPAPPTATATATAPPVSRAERRLQSQALAVDSTVFDYDGVYDSLKAAERRMEEIKKAADADKQPKFMHQAIAAAKRRELDRFRAEQKMAQREREKEGEEFNGTEMFVTEAYKRQQEEVERAAEEERKYEEQVRKGQRGSGMSGFYKNMLDDGEEKHQAAVNAASATGNQSSGPSLAIRPPTKRDEQYEPEAEYDPFLAREATTTGPSTSTTKTKDNDNQVEINDDGEVVDKRSLLKAGLNIMKKPKSDIPSLLAKTKSQPLEGPYKSRAVGTAASYTERMERERRRLEMQMKEQEEKKRLEEEQRAKEDEEAARKRREGDDGEAERKRQEAKERFLARKRAREQGGESEAKKAKGDEE
ncbi:coiled-coil domain-containing protein 55-domain containing protein [Naematelia encephala]|uniref:Coiled-coil domain-containing protein 55-domain containing protein n=1 Tax=Naematelia encephala TaxID=71784 RepID=A0A1Y2ARF3_9TREE|nr:coiled-coil domain-containing protein 55-domain containing protein [Naematelia encephala]